MDVRVIRERMRECVQTCVRLRCLLQLLTTPLPHSAFINHIFSFLGIGLSLYIIANIYTWVSNDAVIKNTVKCKFCRKRISEKVCLFANTSLIVMYFERGEVADLGM